MIECDNKIVWMYYVTCISTCFAVFVSKHSSMLNKLKEIRWMFMGLGIGPIQNCARTLFYSYFSFVAPFTYLNYLRFWFCLHFVHLKCGNWINYFFFVGLEDTKCVDVKLHWLVCHGNGSFHRNCARSTLVVSFQDAIIIIIIIERCSELDTINNSKTIIISFFFFSRLSTKRSNKVLKSPMKNPPTKQHWILLYCC